MTNTISKIENRQVQPVAGSDFHKSIGKVCGYVTSSMTEQDQELGSHVHKLICTALIRSRFYFHSKHRHWKNVLCCL